MRTHRPIKEARTDKAATKNLLHGNKKVTAQADSSLHSKKKISLSAEITNYLRREKIISPRRESNISAERQNIRQTIFSVYTVSPL